MTNIIPVFLASDENFAKYMAVTIQSIISNTKEQIHFCILDGGITNTSKKRIAKILENTHHEIEFLNVGRTMFSNFPVIRHFSINTYFRYLISSLKPEFNKVLYIDTDMIVNGDVKEIFEIDISQQGIGAVPYMDEYYNKGMYCDYKNSLAIPEKHLYFNAGLLLIDCEYWRKNDIEKLLFDKTSELKDKLDMPDQDILNVVFDDYKRLDDKFNIVVDLTCDYKDIEQFVSSIEGCFVLHYTGGRKMRPWMNKKVPFDFLFWNYAFETDFYEELKADLISNQIINLQDLLIKNNKTDLNKTYKVFLFGFIPLLKIIKKTKKIYIKIFNCITLLSIKRK